MNKAKQLQEKKLEFNLVYANKTKEDILLLKELEDFKHYLSLRTCYFVEKEENLSESFNNNNYNKNEDILKDLVKQGLINKNNLKEFLPEKDNKEHLILVCGSKAMSGLFLRPMLLDLGYSSDQIVIF